MKKKVKGFAALISAGILAVLCIALYAQVVLPDEYTMVQGEELVIPFKFPISAAFRQESVDVFALAEQGAGKYSAELNLPGNISVKQVSVQVMQRQMVIPCGNPFGIKMFTEGVMIVGMSDIQVGSVSVNPSKEAGLRTGDLLISIDGKAVARNEDVARIVSESQGNAVRVCVLRGSEQIEATLTPVQTGYDKIFRAGIWVRDSSAGIGTMTYYDPSTMQFAGLGHAICDVDTGKLMPLSSGEIVNVNISGINTGQSGRPGELRGTFSGAAIGRLHGNTELGIFGQLYTPSVVADPIPMAFKQEVLPGPAQIYATISGSQPRAYDVVIEKVNYSDSSQTKNMVVRVVDPGLLSASGGIVQGMSGSPIIQDGKLVGAITHVFVNDPTRGYGIFAENMDQKMRTVESGRKAA